jgi:hypothetical protein
MRHLYERYHTGGAPTPTLKRRPHDGGTPNSRSAEYVPGTSALEWFAALSSNFPEVGYRPHAAFEARRPPPSSIVLFATWCSAAKDTEQTFCLALKADIWDEGAMGLDRQFCE